MATRKTSHKALDDSSENIILDDIERRGELEKLQQVRSISIDMDEGYVVIGDKRMNMAEEPDLIAVIKAFKETCSYIDDDDIHKYRRFNIALENFQRDCNDVEVRNFELLQELKGVMNV